MSWVGVEELILEEMVSEELNQDAKMLDAFQPRPQALQREYLVVLRIS